MLEFLDFVTGLGLVHSTRGVHLILARMRLLTAWLQELRGNCAYFMG